MSELLPSDIARVRLTSRPVAVPYNYRLMYKLAQLVLIMGLCCGNKGCSMQKLQMISMSLESQHDFGRLLAFIKGSLQYPVIRFDPSVNRAVLFALSEKVIFQQANGLFRLTPKGRGFLNELSEDHHILVVEKNYVKEVSTLLTESMIKNIMANWRACDVEN